MLPSYLHNNVFSAPNWTFVHGFCVLVPNYVANHVVFWSNFCRESRCFGDTFRPLKKVLVTQKGFFPGLFDSGEKWGYIHHGRSAGQSLNRTGSSSSVFAPR